jgi:sec-independent protein translocase protein TatA
VEGFAFPGFNPRNRKAISRDRRFPAISILATGHWRLVTFLKEERMGRIGFWEIVVIIGVFVVLFGAKKIPEIASALGKALKEFKKAGKDVEDDIKKSLDK